MPDWTTLISNAALGLQTERGANARTADEVLGEQVLAIATDGDLAGLFSACRSMVVAEPDDARLAPASLEMRTIANALVNLGSRLPIAAMAQVQRELLIENCWGRFNRQWQGRERAQRIAFSPRNADALYVRAILREFGSGLTAAETNGHSSLFAADPMIMLDLLERDGNISRFLSLMIAYANQGWLHPADLVLRFDRWQKFILNAARSDLVYRSSLSVVGQADELARVSEKLVLLAIDLTAKVSDQTEAVFGTIPWVFDGRPFAQTLRELACTYFGANALERSSSERHREVASLARSQESSAVRYLENIGAEAQDLSDEWRGNEESTGEISALICEVLRTKTRPKPMGLKGATQAQLIEFYG